MSDLDRNSVIGEFENSLVLGDFSLNYQPIIDFNKNKVTIIEGLLHWPKLAYFGLSAEELFAEVEKDINLTRLFDRHIINKALADLNKLNQSIGYDGSISINVCPASISSLSFFDFFEYALSTHNVEPTRVILEVTERTAWHDREMMEFNLRKLRRLGVTIAIDDFINSYANLASLLNNCFDIVKLDPSVTRQIPDTDLVCRFCTSFISMINEFEKQVVVEGVETLEQQLFLYEAGYNLMQGYFISKPLPMVLLRKFITEFNAEKLLATLLS